MLVKYTLRKIHALFTCFNKSFVFGVFYRPLASDTRCLEILQKNLERQTPQADIILVGDFNYRAIVKVENCILPTVAILESPNEQVSFQERQRQLRSISFRSMVMKNKFSRINM